MTDKIFDRYVAIGELLGEMFAPALEVIVHDFSNPEESIIFIANGEITGRKVGGPMTDLGERRLQDPGIADAIIGYKNKSPKGHRMKSSSLAIRDDDHNLIGSFCLNLELTAFEQYEEFISSFLQVNESDVVGPKENFGQLKAEESVEEAFDSYVARHGLSSKQLSADDRRRLVESLYDDGVFEKKGAASTIARKLNVTRASVYNYLKQA